MLMQVLIEREDVYHTKWLQSNLIYERIATIKLVESILYRSPDLCLENKWKYDHSVTLIMRSSTALAS
jgi:hypothetical protein